MKSLEFQKIALLLSRQYKIVLRQGKGWCCNIANRIVYYIDQDIHELPEDHILGLLLHEIAHIHYSSGVDFPIINRELIKNATNMLEDIAIENLISKDYPNAGEILESTTQEVLDELIKILPKLRVSDHEKALLYASTRFQGRGYTTNTAKYEILGQAISEVMIKHKEEIINRQKTSDLVPLARTIVSLMINQLGQPSDEDKRRMEYDAERQTNGDQYEPDGAKQNRRNLIKGINGTKNGTKKFTAPHSDIEFISEIIDQASIIGRRLRTILKRNNAMEFGGRFRSGKILPKRLIRMKVLKDRRAFAKRIVKSNQSYAFALTSDVSGSMFGNRANTPASNSISSMFMVAEALRTANIPRSLGVFGEEAITISAMGKTAVPWDQIAEDRSIRMAGQGCTNIELGMNKCIEELNKTKAERKVMIVLTDGAGSDEDVRNSHEIAKKQNIECIGITVGQSSQGTLGRVFGEKNNIMLSNPKDIGPTFIGILKKTVTVSEKQ